MEQDPELTALYNLGATENILRELAREEDHDNAVVCELPFASLQDSAAQAVTVPVTFGGNSINFSLRKDLSDGAWWITEEGTVNGEAYSSVQRFNLNSFHHIRDSWEYIIISPYEYNEQLSDQLKRQCVANSSLLIKY